MLCLTKEEAIKHAQDIANESGISWYVHMIANTDSRNIGLWLVTELPQVPMRFCEKVSPRGECLDKEREDRFSRWNLTTQQRLENKS